MRTILAAALCALALPATAAADTWTQTSAFGSHGSAPGQLDQPIGLGVAPDDGTIWVADGVNNRVQQFAADGTAPEIIGAGQFNLTEDVVVRDARSAYASDCYGNRILRISRGKDPTVDVLYDDAAAVRPGERLDCPEHMAFGPDGYLYVADTFNNRIVVLNPGAEFPFVRALGAGTLFKPRYVAFDPAGDLVVDDNGADTCPATKVETLNRTTGALISQFGTAGSSAGQLFCVVGLAVDPAGNFYVGDANGRIQAFTPAGAYAGLVAAHGTGPGQVMWSADIEVQPGCDLLVLDRDGSQVKRLAKAPAGCAPLVAAPAATPGSGATAPPATTPPTGAGSTFVPVTTIGTAFRPRPRGRRLTVIVRCGTQPCVLSIGGRVVVGKAPHVRSAAIARVTKRLAAGASSSVNVVLPKTALAALKAGTQVTVVLDARSGGKVLARTSARLRR